MLNLQVARVKQMALRKALALADKIASVYFLAELAIVINFHRVRDWIADRRRQIDHKKP